MVGVGGCLQVPWIHILYTLHSSLLASSDEHQTFTACKHVFIVQLRFVNTCYVAGPVLKTNKQQQNKPLLLTPFTSYSFCLAKLPFTCDYHCYRSSWSWPWPETLFFPFLLYPKLWVSPCHQFCKALEV